MDMIQKVARAICKEATGDENIWGDFQIEAIAAIKAMREPSNGMLDASWKQTGESREMRCRTHAHYKRHYTAMIDAALGEHK